MQYVAVYHFKDKISGVIGLFSSVESAEVFMRKRAILPWSIIHFHSLSEYELKLADTLLSKEKASNG